MANKRTFEMGGKNYTSMMEIARELGIKRVYPKDFAKYGITEITDSVDKAVTADDVADKDVVDTNATVSTEKPADEVKTDNTVSKTENKEETQMKKNATKKAVKPATKKTAKATTELEDYSIQLRNTSLEDLVELAQKEGVDTYDNVADAKIRRMRLTMALKAKKFPGQKLPAKKVSFKHVSLDELKEFAKEVGVIDYVVTSEERTQKMWIIHALNQAGYYDIPEKKMIR